MSRSVFAARFADALGQSPIEFLKTLRLARCHPAAPRPPI
jgi:transcriptional regulator GlxA family with amidase domain